MATRDIYATGFDEDVQHDSKNSCPECGGRVNTHCRETICEDCGLVIDEQYLDRGPEWRPFDSEDRKRVGPARTERRHDHGLSTTIGRNRDGNGNVLSGKKRRQMGRLRREQSRGRWGSKAERNLGHGLAEVRRVAGDLDLADSLTDQACQLFRTAQNQDLLPGRSIEAFAAASVAATCRVNGLSRTLQEVTEHAQVCRDRVRNAYRVLNDELGLPTKPMTPSAFVPKLASALEVRDQVRQRARQLAEQAEAEGLATGKRPQGFAAGCIYVAAQEAGRHLTQTRVAEVADTSTTTIRSHRDALETLST